MGGDDSMTDQQVWGLIFEAGFSTAKEVTNLSGRGVGMDVVRRNITSLGGGVSVSSVRGEGTTITIQLPLTLSSGQRRRLALASCFVRPRRLLVLDEPEQRLDAAGKDWLARRLLREKADGVAVLMASHDPELVEATADVRLPIGEG